MTMPGDEGFLTLTTRMRVSPEPEVVELLKKYRDALNYAIMWIIENSIKVGKRYRTPSISAIHRTLYEKLKSYGLPSRVAIDCYREALAIAKSYLGNGANGRIPRVKSLRMWLTSNQSYRIREGYVEIIGGYRLRIIGWDRRYDNYEDREARLVYKGNKMFLMITKRVPKPKDVVPRWILAVDVNERYIYYGNRFFIDRIGTAIDRAVHYRKLAEDLQRRYSSTRYNAWIRRRGILDRIRYFYRKARNIVEDWARKTALEIVMKAKQNSYAVAREDLNGLIESLRKLPKDHRVKMMILSYRKLVYWIDWQSQKHGVRVIIVDPKDTSSECPKCRSKMVENGYRKMKCPLCGFEADRDIVAILNIEKKALKQMGGLLAALTAPQMTDVSPNRCGEPMNPEGNTHPSEWGEGQICYTCIFTT
ncbi:transposase, IS605 OrfB family [Ignisphaera aggregans DSM 17230]|uniref:Transposase, IS605 OrfB family n=1 Tax=Ignisphaera aggregans (strain DSM 17230 / JCM 13409 / AQ1.S1) TaxID=583356 RepID=E0SRT3_IGNAA|nr:transposase, IS605 OrfB family [Ignisphaera aggregans DSM 17230]